MAIFAIGQITNVGPVIDASSQTYTLQFEVSVLVSGGSTQGASQISRPPVTLSAKKADRFVREDMAAAVLAQLNLTIDPNDIYIPFSGN